MIDFFLVYAEYWSDWWPRMLNASKVTAMLTFSGFFIATVIGLLLSVFVKSEQKILRLIAKIYVMIFRGVPLLAVLFLLYFGLTDVGISLSSFAAGSIALGLCFGAQMAEVFRSGLEAIHKGQREAALSIGMAPTTIFWQITLPQVIKVILPTLVITFVVLLKDSTLCALITVNELMLEGQSLSTEYFLPLHIFIAIGLFYFAIAWPLSILSRRLEARLAR